MQRLQNSRICIQSRLLCVCNAKSLEMDASCMTLKLTRYQEKSNVHEIWEAILSEFASLRNLIICPLPGMFLTVSLGMSRFKDASALSLSLLRLASACCSLLWAYCHNMELLTCSFPIEMAQPSSKFGPCSPLVASGPSKN